MFVLWHLSTQLAQLAVRQQKGKDRQTDQHDNVNQFHICLYYIASACFVDIEYTHDSRHWAVHINKKDTSIYEHTNDHVLRYRYMGG